MQSERSLFLIIDYDHKEDFHTVYASSLRQIFTCSDLGAQLESFSAFQLFTYDQIMRAYSMDERNSSQNEHHDMISDQAKRFLACSCALCQNS